MIWTQEMWEQAFRRAAKNALWRHGSATMMMLADGAVSAYGDFLDIMDRFVEGEGWRRTSPQTRDYLGMEVIDFERVA